MIGFEMKYGVAEFSVARAREVREAFDDLRRIARNQLWNHVIVQTREESAVAGEITAIQQGNRELGIFRIEAAAFCESARGGTELQSQIPKILGKFADCVFQHRFRAVSGVQKQHVNIGIRKKPAATKAAQGYRRETRRAIKFRREVLRP